MVTHFSIIGRLLRELAVPAYRNLEPLQEPTNNGKICYHRLLTSMHIFHYHQSAHMPQICKRYLVPPDFNDNIELLYSSSDLYVTPENGLTGRGRNM